MFSNRWDARRHCEHCGFFYSRESGYFLGSAFFGYGATVAVAIGTWVILGYVFGLGWNWVVLAVLVPLVLLFPIWFFRYSRMLWLAFDLDLNPPVQEDFEARGR